MTRAARKSAPQDAAPAAKTVVSPAVAPASTPDSEPDSEPVSTPSNLTDIGQCWVLPLAADGAVYAMPDFAPRSIQRFADRDGTTMVVVAVDGALHKTPAPPKELA